MWCRWISHKLRLFCGVASALSSVRLLVVIASLVAWFAASNHCALAAGPVDSGMPADCPMHAKHQPQKQNGCDDLPCCKNLQATPSAAAKLVINPIWAGALLTFSALPLDEVRTASLTRCAFSDTGPPGECSFAELVLQRSILAHAPPFSLS
jgi:hypothetical protein